LRTLRRRRLVVRPPLSCILPAKIRLSRHFLRLRPNEERRESGEDNASSKNFFGGTGKSSTGGENDECAVHQLEQNRQVYLVEGADATIQSARSSAKEHKVQEGDGAKDTFTLPNYLRLFATAVERASKIIRATWPGPHQLSPT
jgi:hypothetical protein